MYYLENNIYPENIDYFIISSIDKNTFDTYSKIIENWFLHNKTAKIILTYSDENNLDNKYISPKKILNLYPIKHKEFEFVGIPNNTYMIDEIKKFYGFKKLNNSNILMVSNNVKRDLNFSIKNNFQYSYISSDITKLQNLNDIQYQKIDYIIPDISYLCF